jgi:hypothetical protein
VYLLHAVFGKCGGLPCPFRVQYRDTGESASVPLDCLEHGDTVFNRKHGSVPETYHFDPALGEERIYHVKGLEQQLLVPTGDAGNTRAGGEEEVSGLRDTVKEKSR